MNLPINRSTKKISFEEAAERFKKYHPEIILLYKQYSSWREPAWFFDLIIKKSFRGGCPKDILNNRSVHPDRRKEKQLKTRYKARPKKIPPIKKTMKEIVKNRQQTMLKRYGFDNPSKIKSFQEKKQKTSLEHWGVVSPLSKGSSIRNNILKTNMTKYGGAGPACSESIRNKMRQTMLEKYGVEHYPQTSTFQFEQSKKVQAEDGLTLFPLKEWLQKNVKEPIPSRITALQWFLNKEDIIPELELRKQIDRYQSSKTGLERLFESLTGLPHFNQKPKELSSPYQYRPDFQLNNTVFVNLDGLYWHGEKYHSRSSHKNLREAFEKSGLRLLQFREHEIKEKFPIIWSICQNAIGHSQNKIFARKCMVVCDITQKEANKFLFDNHLKGPKNARHIGLKKEGIIVSLLSYKTNKNICKIERFCSLLNTNVLGGFGKLLKALEAAIDSSCDTIHYWVDLRYGMGNYLEAFHGFKRSHDTIGWEWTDGDRCFNRLKCRASLNSTEKENANSRGWFRIYDAGQRLWKKNISKS